MTISWVDQTREEISLQPRAKAAAPTCMRLKLSCVAHGEKRCTARKLPSHFACKMQRARRPAASAIVCDSRSFPHRVTSTSTKTPSAARRQTDGRSEQRCVLIRGEVFMFWALPTPCWWLETRGGGASRNRAGSDGPEDQFFRSGD